MATSLQPTPVDTWNAGLRFVETPGGRVALRNRGDGPPLLLIHGFPTWSYDWAALAARLPGRRLILPDLIGFGWSDKPRGRYSIAMQADAIAACVASTGLDAVDLVAHDYGTIVGQELLRRAAAGALAFGIGKIAMLNAGIVASLHRPRPMQRMLLRPVLGRVVSALTTEARLRAALAATFGADHPLTDADWDALFAGMRRRNGHRLGHRLIHYIPERRTHGDHWEKALVEHGGPLALIWGLADPVSGAHLLDVARQLYA